MTDSRPPQPRKRPKQGRSTHLVEAIQQACQQILENEGAEHLSTQRIADVAGVTIGSLYQYFPNKEAVIADVFENKMARDAEATIVATRKLKVFRDGDLEQIVSTIISLETDLLLQYHQLDPDFYRQYQSNFDIHKRVDRLTQAHKQPPMDEWFLTIVQKHARTYGIENPELSSFLALRALEGILKATVNERPALLKSDEFKQQLTTMIVHYLQAGTASL